MPMVRLLKPYEYGGATQPKGTRLTVANGLYNWLVRQNIAEPVGNSVVPITGAVSQAPQREQAVLLQQPKYRRCKPCGW